MHRLWKFLARRIAPHLDRSTDRLAGVEIVVTASADQATARAQTRADRAAARAAYKREFEALLADRGKATRAVWRRIDIRDGAAWHRANQTVRHWYANRHAALRDRHGMPSPQA
jgi:hypothetical protein